MQVPVPGSASSDPSPNGNQAQGVVLIDVATGLPYKAATSGPTSQLVYTSYKAIAGGTGYSNGDLLIQIDEWNTVSNPPTLQSTTWRNATQGTTLSSPPASANIIPLSATATSVSVSNFPATQPVSAAALPLPANAAQETGGNLATVAAAQGAGGTGIVQPTGGSGILGFLSGIWNKLNTSIAATIVQLPTSIGQKTTAQSLSICLPSDQGPLLPNIVTTGNLTASSGAGSTVTFSAGGILNTIGIALDFTTGSGVGTTVFEKSVDNGSSWDLVSVLQLGIGNTYVNSATASGRFQTGDGAIQLFRVRCSAYTSGTIAVTLVGTQGIGTMAVSQANPANLNATVVNSNPATAVTTQFKITSTGTPQQLPSNTFVNGFVVKAKAASVGGAGNAANLWLGGSGVTTTDDGTGNGYRLSPGEANSYALPNSNALYVIGTAGDVLYIQGN